MRKARSDVIMAEHSEYAPLLICFKYPTSTCSPLVALFSISRFLSRGKDNNLVHSFHDMTRMCSVTLRKAWKVTERSIGEGAHRETNREELTGEEGRIRGKG